MCSPKKECSERYSYVIEAMVADISIYLQSFWLLPQPHKVKKLSQYEDFWHGEQKPVRFILMS